MTVDVKDVAPLSELGLELLLSESESSAVVGPVVVGFVVLTVTVLRLSVVGFVGLVGSVVVGFVVLTVTVDPVVRLSVVGFVGLVVGGATGTTNGLLVQLLWRPTLHALYKTLGL